MQDDQSTAKTYRDARYAARAIAAPATGLLSSVERLNRYRRAFAWKAARWGRSRIQSRAQSLIEVAWRQPRAIVLAPVRNIPGRLVDAMADPARQRSAVIWTIAAYGLLWTLYAVLSKSAQGVHTDMGEIVVWSRDLAWGTPKHPPLLPVMAWLWFLVFPLTDWAYYLLSFTMVGVTIYAVWLIAGFWLDGFKRAAVPFLLMLLPSANFLAIRFDHNQALTPLWMLTIYAALRAFRSPSNAWGIAAGLSATLALMAKYWSAMLTAAITLAFLLHQRRWQFLKSPACWLGVAVAVLGVMPHVAWLVSEHFATFTYASKHAARSWTELSRAIGMYGLGAVGYPIVSILFVLVLARPSRAALWDSIAPHDPDRRLMTRIFWVALLLPVPVAILFKTKLSALWVLQILPLVPLMLLSSPKVEFTRAHAVFVARAAIVVTFGALMVSPVLSLLKVSRGAENYSLYTPSLALEVDRFWRGATKEPLRLLAGPSVIVNSVAFYAKDKPLTYGDFSTKLSPWVDDNLIDDWGMAIVCPASDAQCMSVVTDVENSGGHYIEIDVTPKWLWWRGARKHFVIGIMPPEW